MKKTNKIGIFTSTTTLIGGMIGSAIFSLSGITMYDAGPASVIAWILAGLIMLIYGLLMAEMAAYYPKSGGTYVFPSRAIGGEKGKIFGWLSCWGTIILNIIAVSFAAIFVGQYLSMYFDWANGMQIPFAIISVAVITILNIIKFSTAGKINNVLVAILIITIAIYVCVALFGGNFDSSKLVPFFTQGYHGPGGILISIPTAIVGYGAIISIAFMVEEVKEPKKTIPIASIIAIIVVITIYSLMIISTMGLVTAQFLSENPNMQYIPIFAACFVFLQNTPWLAGVVSISAVVALLTSMHVCMSMNTRTIQAAAIDGILPKIFEKQNKQGVAILPVFATAICSAAISFFPSFTNEIVSFGVIFNVFTICVCVISLMIARKKNKLPNGAFRLAGGNFWPIVLLIILIACNIVDIFSGNIGLYVFTAIFILIALIIYFIRKPKINPEA